MLSPKAQKKKKKKNLPDNIRARMTKDGPFHRQSRIPSLSRFHPPFYILVCCSSFFFFRLILKDSPAGKFIPDRRISSCGKDGMYFSL